MGDPSYNKTVENSCFTTWMDDDGICHTQVKENAVIELKHAVANRQDVKTVAGETIPPMIVDVRKIQSISRDARDYFAMRNRKPGVSAIAMIIDSEVSKMIVNLYLQFSKPTVPTKLFTSEEKAVEWLRENYIGKK